MESEVLRDRPGVSDAMGVQREVEGGSSVLDVRFEEGADMGRPSGERGRGTRRTEMLLGMNRGASGQETGWRAGCKTGKVRVERIQSTNTTEYPQGAQRSQGRAFNNERTGR